MLYGGDEYDPYIFAFDALEPIGDDLVYDAGQVAGAALGSMLVVGDRVDESSGEMTFSFFDVNTWNLKYSHAVEVTHGNDAIAVSEDGLMAVVGDPLFATALLVDMPTGEVLYQFDEGFLNKALTRKFDTGMFISFADIQFSPDNRYVLFPYQDEQILWDIRSRQTLHALVWRTTDDWDNDWGSRVLDTGFDPDGKSVLVLFANFMEDKIETILWDVETGRQVWRHHSGGTDFEYMPDGDHILIAGGEQLFLVDPETDRIVREFQTAHSDTISAIDISPDGKLAATGSADASVVLWNLETGEPIYRYEGHTAGVVRVAFSLDGKMLLSKGGDTRIWRVSALDDLIHEACSNHPVRNLTERERDQYDIPDEISICN